jgi:hypothetical protein
MVAPPTPGRAPAALATQTTGEIQMTDVTLPQQTAKSDFAAPMDAGFKLSKQETLFFECVIDALRDNGVKPPKNRTFPNSVRRVVDYDHVKMLMAKRMLSEEDRSDEGRKRHAGRVKMALNRNREALMNFKIIGTSNPYIWYTGKLIRGFDLLPARLPTSKH